MSVWYNEIDPYAAQWLKNLIAAGLIPSGDVDTRSIVDVQPEDLAGYVQCHFFAGIAGWSEALRLAGWPPNKPVWTGSCPCQPLSCAGPRTGHADERHLWPAFYRLIAKCRPSVVFGEQTSSKDGLEWLAGVRADMEAAGYAFGAANLPSAGVGAPHPRHRLHWVAYANGRHASAEGLQRSGQHGQFEEDGGDLERLANTGGSRIRGRVPPKPGRDGPHDGIFGPDGRACAQGLGHAKGQRSFLGTSGGIHCPTSGGGSWRGASEQPSDDAKRLGDTESEGSQGQWRLYRPSGERHRGLAGFAMQAGVPQWNGPTVAVRCEDGARRVSAQPGAFPLAAGVLKRMGQLRAAGNAINPHLAAEFIQAAEECRP